MLLIRTQLKNSAIHGIGLFADQFVPAGALVWRYTPGIDQKIEAELVACQPEIAREYIHRYGYLNPKTNLFVLHGDDARFLNHSSTPNIESRTDGAEEEDIDVAARDISPGEELTSNYAQFDAEYREKLPHQFSC